MRNKKKGFTLIELLAVIVILAIITIIAVPKILNVIENSERKAFSESAGLMARAAQLKYSQGNLTSQVGDETYIYENGELTNNSPELTFKGDKPNSGIIVQKNGRVTLAVISKNKKWCAIKNEGQRLAKVYKIGDEINSEDCKIGYTGGENKDDEEINNMPIITKEFFQGFSDKDKVESIKFLNTLEGPSDSISSFTINNLNGEVKGYLSIAKVVNNVPRFNLTITGDGGLAIKDDMSYMFQDYTNLTEISFDNLDTSKVTNMEGLFAGPGSSLTNIDLSNLNTKNVTTMESMFDGCSSLTSLDLSNLNTKNVTNMKRMFESCSSLTSLDLSNFNTSNVADMYGMFENCSSLTNLNLSNFDTSKVTTMRLMFAACSSLTNIDLRNFNTSNVTHMGGMYNGCSSLISLDLSSFDTSKVTEMSYMFAACSSLTQLDLSNFYTPNLYGTEGMFQSCENLANLDLSNFDFTGVTIDGVFYGRYMFKNTLQTMNITVKDNFSKDWVIKRREDENSDYITNITIK